MTLLLIFYLSAVPKYRGRNIFIGYGKISLRVTVSSLGGARVIKKSAAKANNKIIAIIVRAYARFTTLDPVILFNFCPTRHRK